MVDAQVAHMREEAGGARAEAEAAKAASERQVQQLQGQLAAAAAAAAHAAAGLQQQVQEARGAQGKMEQKLGLVLEGARVAAQAQEGQLADAKVRLIMIGCLLV